MFQLRHNNKRLYPGIRIEITDKFIYDDLYKECCSNKNQIDDIFGDKHSHHNYRWDRAKKKMNKYEMVHTIGTNVDVSGQVIENIYPLSRAFFKMIEIYDECKVIPDEYKLKAGVIANIAEAPGGFMEAIYQRRRLTNIEDKMYGITLTPSNNSIPGWEQMIKKKGDIIKNMILTYGNIYNPTTIIGYISQFKDEKAFLVTCDGGFDYSKDFNNQEMLSRRIVYAEIVTALHIQEQGGTLVCKVFDLFTEFSLKLVYLLTFLYDDVYLFKPKSSRPANSEKYVIAKNFRGADVAFLVNMMTYIRQEYDKDANSTKPTFEDKNMYASLDEEEKIDLHTKLTLSSKFVKEMKEYVAYFLQEQKSYITGVVSAINGADELPLVEDMSRSWFDTYHIKTKGEVAKRQQDQQEEQGT